MNTLDIKKTAALLLTAVVLTLQACTSDTRLSQARERLEQQVKNESKGLIKLKTLEKVNGQESNILGSKMYEMDFKITIEYLDDCYKNSDNWGGLFNNYFTVLKDPRQDRSFYNVYAQPNFTRIPKGTREEITGAAYYEMKEKGWLLNELNLKSSKQLE